MGGENISTAQILEQHANDPVKFKKNSIRIIGNYRINRSVINHFLQPVLNAKTKQEAIIGLQQAHHGKIGN
jgi:hypothetical protein